MRYADLTVFAVFVTLALFGTSAQAGLIAVERGDPSGTPVNVAKITFHLRFSVNVSSLAASDFEVTTRNAETTTAVVSNPVRIDSNNYQLDVSGGDFDDFEGLISLSLNASHSIMADGAVNDFALTDPQYYQVERPPVADAGTGGLVVPGATVTLDGSASRDPGESAIPTRDALAYQWTYTGTDPAITLTGATTVNPTFMVPAKTNSLQTIPFSLLVTTPSVTAGAAFSESNLATVSYTVAANIAPVVDAGSDITISGTGGGTVTVTGSASDADDPVTSLTLTWTQITTVPGVVISDPTILSPEITLPTVTESTTIVLELCVQDALGLSTCDTLTITINPINVEQAQTSSIELSSRVLGFAQLHVTDHVATTRIERRFQEQRASNIPQTASMASEFQNWFAVNSDQLFDTHVAQQNTRTRAKLEHAGLDTAFLDQFESNQRNQKSPWDFYTAGGYANLHRDGDGGYDGFYRYATLGVDYLFTPELVIGTNLHWEWSNLEYDNAINGDLRKQGAHLDAYVGWQLREDLVAEATLSYAWLNNQIEAGFEDGETRSNRFAAQGKLIGLVDVLGAQVEPFLWGQYAKETFDDYMTDGQVLVSPETFEQARGIAGFEIASSEPVLFGLSPFIGAQAEFDWHSNKSVILADNSQISFDEWGATTRVGLKGVVRDFGQGYFLGRMLEGATVDIDYTRSNFGRQDTYDFLQWSITMPL